MANEAASTVLRLVTILRRNFATVGNPPQMSEWMFESPFVIKKPDGQADERLVQRIRDISENCMLFSSLLVESPNEVAVVALAEIPPLREAVGAIRSVQDLIVRAGSKAALLEYHFRQLLDCQWAENFLFTLKIDAAGKLSQMMGFGLRPVEDRLMQDLLEAADELSELPERPPLTEKEQTILEAVGNDILTGPQIAEKAGYTYNQGLRSYLSGMVKRHLLAKIKGRSGYKRA